MSTRSFRFGVVAGGSADAAGWADLARSVEELGYSTMLLPDNVSAGIVAPLPALTAAATATRSLRVGTFVLNCAVRNPMQLAWEAASVDFLSGGRLELGLGAGRPGAESDGQLLGVPFGSPRERVARLRETIDAYEALVATNGRGHAAGMFARTVQDRPPLLIAAGGDRMLELAGARADIVTFGLPPRTTDDGLAERTQRLRELAGDRFEHLELGINLAAIGADLPPWLSRIFGGDDPQELIEMGSITLLAGSPDDMADTLLRRRDKTGVSYVTVNADYREQFAPVVERVAGK
ncbi:MAG: TIGR03621 family F420-dependent LLM class oxidoreductase [Streptosporangiales bacterium]